MSSRIKVYTASWVEEAIEEVQESEHPMKSIFMGHLKCMVNRLNSEDLNDDQIQSIGQACESMTERAKKNV